jgi:hypothetical protein
MLELLGKITLKALGYLLPISVRWYYTTNRLSERIKIRVRGEGDGISINCGELPSVQIWLTITNFTPFPMELDRIYGQIFYGCGLGHFVHPRRYSIPPAEEKDILIDFDLNERQVQHVLRNVGKLETHLSISVYIDSKIRNLELNRHIPTRNARFLNCVTA